MKLALLLSLMAIISTAHAENYLCETSSGEYFLSLDKNSGMVYEGDSEGQEVVVERNSGLTTVIFRRTVKTPVDWQGKCMVSGKPHIDFMLDFKNGEEEESYYQILPNFIVKPNSSCAVPMVSPGRPQPMSCKLVR